MPIFFTELARICASCGISANFSVVSVTLNPRRITGLRHQLLRKSEIQVPLGQLLTVDGIDGRKRRVVAEIAVAAEQLLDDLRTVERQRDRLPDAQVHQGLDGDGHAA